MVNPRVGQIVYYMLPNREVRPFMVVIVKEENIGGYVYLAPGDDGIAAMRWEWATTATSKGVFHNNVKPGNWYYPFPEL